VTAAPPGAALRAWVSDPPAHWRTNWLKWHVSLSTKRPTEDEIERLPYIANEDIASWTGKLLNPDPRPANADSRRFHRDDVLFNKLRPYLAKVYHADFDGLSSGELLCLRPSFDVWPRYLFYVVSSKVFIDAVDAQTFGSKMPRADWDIVGHQPLPLPPLETQTRIAAFLDEKTARIDALIAKKQALLDRLAEKRQAIITQAVTKGLNPHAPMKDSGVAWMGRIPAHWGVRRVKYIAKLESGHTPDKKIEAYWTDCDIPWVSLNDTEIIRASDYISDTTFKTNLLGIANSSARILPARAVVFTRDATIGESAIITKPMAVSQHLIAWLCDETKIIPEYLLLLIYGMTEELKRLTNGATIGTIGLGDVKELRACVPSPQEQSELITHVFDKKSELDRVADKIIQSVEMLLDYRASVIDSFVTGKQRQIQREAPGEELVGEPADAGPY
jgi:type I restriction enzyme, S subunit